MITTSCYSSCNLNDGNFHYCSISGDRGKRVGYVGKCYRALAPKLSFWEIWHSNIGKIPVLDNDRFYVREYYKQVLSKLDPKEVYKELDDQTTILLCYEPHNEFCHRHIVSAWMELATGKIVPEIMQQENSNLINVSKPIWVKEYLEDIIKSCKMPKR